MKRRINEEISYGFDNDELEKELDDMDASDARDERKSKFQRLRDKHKSFIDKQNSWKDDVKSKLKNALTQIASCSNIIMDVKNSLYEISNEFNTKEDETIRDRFTIKFVENPNSRIGCKTFQMYMKTIWPFELGFFADSGSSTSSLTWHVYNKYFQNDEYIHDFTKVDIIVNFIFKWDYQDYNKYKETLSKDEYKQRVIQFCENIEDFARKYNRSYWEKTLKKIDREIDKIADMY